LLTRAVRPRLGSDSRLTGAFALHGGAAPLTRVALNPRHVAVAGLLGARHFHVRSDSRVIGAVIPCMDHDAILTRALRLGLGSDSRLTGAFALDRGAAALTIVSF